VKLSVVMCVCLDCCVYHHSWCGPCKILVPRLESLVSQKDGKVLLAKIDIDANTELAMDYEVISTSPRRSGKYCDAYVCLSVCLFVSARVFQKPHGQTSSNFWACFLWPWLSHLPGQHFNN